MDRCGSHGSSPSKKEKTDKNTIKSCNDVKQYFSESSVLNCYKQLYFCL